MQSLSLQTPLGQMLSFANESGVCSLDFTDDALPAKNDKNPHLEQLEYELREYFDGKRREFGVALCPQGTPFQLDVWNTLLKIPYASTISYAKEAQMLGRASAFRAVANANGKNPISIIIPCHRVIASSGGIGGYSGGLWRKEFLLKHESKFC